VIGIILPTTKHLFLRSKSVNMEKLKIIIIDDENDEINDVIIPTFINGTILNGIAEILTCDSIMTAKDKIEKNEFAALDFLFLDQMFESELGYEDDITSINTIVPLIRKHYPDCRIILLSKNGCRNIFPYQYFVGNEYYLPYPRKEYHFKYANEIIKREYEYWNKRILNNLSLDELNDLKSNIKSNNQLLEITHKDRVFTMGTLFANLSQNGRLVVSDIYNYLFELPVINIEGWDNVDSKISAIPLKEYARECFTNPEWYLELQRGEEQTIDFVKIVVLLKSDQSITASTKSEYNRKLSDSVVEWGFTSPLGNPIHSPKPVMKEFLKRVMIRRVIAILYLLFDIDPIDIYHILKWKIIDYKIDDNLSPRTYQNPIRYNLFLPLKGWDTENINKRKNQYYKIFNELLFHEDRLLFKKVYDLSISFDLNNVTKETLVENGNRLHLT